MPCHGVEWMIEPVVSDVQATTTESMLMLLSSQLAPLGWGPPYMTFRFSDPLPSLVHACNFVCHSMSSPLPSSVDIIYGSPLTMEAPPEWRSGKGGKEGREESC